MMSAHRCGVCNSEIPPGYTHQCDVSRTADEPEWTVESAVDDAWERNAVSREARSEGVCERAIARGRKLEAVADAARRLTSMLDPTGLYTETAQQLRELDG